MKLLDLSPGEQITALRKGEIDLASTEFYPRKLATFSVLVILPADHRLASRRRIALKELSQERFLSAPEKDLPGRDRWIIQLCRRAGFRPSFTQGAETLSEAFSVVSSEGIIVLVPGYLKDYPAAGVSMVELSDAKATWDFLVVWQRGRMAESLRVLVDALSQRVQEASQR